MITSFQIKAERFFWQLVIPLLSRSKVIRKGIQQGAGLFEKYKAAPKQHKIVLWAFTGWFIGITLGVIGAMII